MSDGLVIRAATPDDEPFLWRMLTFAASMGGTDEDVAFAQRAPELRGYAESFGRAGDVGVIALDGASAIGAAWARLAHDEPHPSKVWTREIPELAIATAPEVRGRGVGEAMMRALIERARELHPAIVLTVREENPAVRLYERLGFVIERRVTNRVGGVSYAMRLALR